jgi:Ca2+-binding RTX toxin-like protein
MNNMVRHKDGRRARLTASAMVVAALLLAATGTAAANGNATPERHAANAWHQRHHARFPHAKLAHGLLTIRGTRASDRIALRLRAGRPDTLQVDVDSRDLLPLEAEVGTAVVRIDDGNGPATAGIPTTIDGGAGRDAIVGGAGIETLVGRDGNDAFDGNGGNDIALMGAGNDVFVWDPGDGSDVVEGGDGTDTMVFNGAAASEQVDLSANGSRLRFFRNPGVITMDTGDVERVNFNALGGSDDITVNDLSATDVDAVNLDLGVNGTGDGQADRVVVNGTNGNDTVDVNGDVSGVAVAGLSTLVSISHPEPTDELGINGLAGNDQIDASGLAAGTIGLALAGGTGDDAIFGGAGIEMLVGGDGIDALDGNGGNDMALMGAGDDVFVWDPGDGSDVVEGDDGTDTMVFNGAAASEQVDLSANGSRLRFFRNPGGITMDTDNVERVDFNALGGSDDITVNDLSATDVDAVNLDLGVNGTGDGQADRVVVNGTNGNDTIDVSGDANIVKVSGLTLTQILHSEVANDRLEVNTLAGTDAVDSIGLAAGAIQLFVDGVLVP